jgi:hypothetical protein
MKRRGFLKSLAVLIVGAPLLPTTIPKVISKPIPKAVVTTIGFDEFIFPIIRNVSIPLVAHDFIKIQPMNVPSGMVFYMDYKYKKPWYQFW